MFKGIRKLLRLSEPEPEKIATEFEVGIEDKKLVIKFNQPTLRIELNRLQTLNLIQALTNKIVLTERPKR